VKEETKTIYSPTKRGEKIIQKKFKKEKKGMLNRLSPPGAPGLTFDELASCLHSVVLVNTWQLHIEQPSTCQSRGTWHSCKYHDERKPLHLPVHSELSVGSLRFHFALETRREHKSKLKTML